MTAPVLDALDLVKEFKRPGVRFTGISSRARAVDNVSMSLREREVVGLVGESGSGKSTVARLLARLERVDSGEILLRGAPVGNTGFREYCSQVQMVFQDPYASLNPLHSVRHHISRPLVIHGLAKSRREVDTRVKEELARVSLSPPDQFIDRFPHELSGGQRQRVAIARALAAGPRVLLADEPISMLDVSIRLGVLNLLERLKNDLSLAVLYITHDIATARYFSNSMLVIYAGQLVEGGSSDQLTEHPAHPYTQLLIASAPNPDRTQSRQYQVRGEPPNIAALPSGCRFHPRCPAAMPICSREGPPVLEVGSGHWARCWLHSPGHGHSHGQASNHHHSDQAPTGGAASTPGHHTAVAS